MNAKRDHLRASRLWRRPMTTIQGQLFVFPKGSVCELKGYQKEKKLHRRTFTFDKDNNKETMVDLRSKQRIGYEQWTPLSREWFWRMSAGACLAAKCVACQQARLRSTSQVAEVTRSKSRQARQRRVRQPFTCLDTIH